MQPIADYLNDPLVAPLWGILVIALVDMILGVYRSIQARAFDWQKLPQMLDSTVLQKVIPLAALGITAFFMTDGTARTAIEAAYVAGCGAALASAVAAIIGKVGGSYVATTKAQDKGC